MKKLLSLSVLASALVLSACGGGGSEDAADKYVGTWLSKCHSYVGNDSKTYFRRTTRVISKSSATEINSTHVQKNAYSEATCNTIDISNTWTYNSGKFNLGKSVTFLGAISDEVVYTDLVTNATNPGFMTVSGGQLYISTYVATDGLPTSWGNRSPYTKQ